MRRRRSPLAAPAALLLLTAAACGDGRDPPTANRPASTTAPAAATTHTEAAADGIVLSARGIGVAPLGARRDDVVGQVTAILGTAPATSGPFASGPSPFGVCPGEQVWSAEWGAFRLLFISGLPSVHDDEPVLHTYFYGLGGQDPTGATPRLATDAGLTIGETLADVKRRYGADRVETHEELPGALSGFSVGEGADRLFGYLESADDEGVVQSIQGGPGCAD